MEKKTPLLKGHLVLALPAMKKFVVLALQAPGNLECRVSHIGRSTKPRWRGRGRRELSPLSAAIHRADKRMLEIWDPIPSDSGCSRKDRKAVLALLVLSHHALLLEKTLEEMVSGVQGDC
jgi:hypothetical protein